MSNSIQSTLNELDIEMGTVLLVQMQLADPRTLSDDDSILLWNSDCVMLVDELDTEEIFNAWLIKNSKGYVDIQYPILGYVANDIEEVSYGQGNRTHHWEFETEPAASDYVVGATIWMINGEYKGDTGTIKNVDDIAEGVLTVTINDVDVEVEKDNTRLTGSKAPSVFKAKQIITSYDSVILCERKKEARYLMNNFIMNCSDGNFWHDYTSEILDGTTLYMFTVFGIPNIKRYPKSADKIKGSGYIYGVSFETKVWGCLATEPLPQGFIEQIRLNVTIDGDNRTNKIVIS